MKIKPSLDRTRVLIELGREDEPLLAKAAAPQFKLHNILVPIDFSECSKKALVYALAMARQFGSAVTVLHVVAPYYAVDPYGLTQYERIEGDLREVGERKLKALVEEFVPDEVQAKVVVTNGRAAAEIVDVALKQRADLIVISTHCYTGFNHVVFGSTAEHVVRHATCPVLTVREHENEFIGG
ncbi:MAG: uspa protein [Verrucomicrobiales bacterium]|nr:uspa protein [Verrucomicrobiales bacterium]